MSDPGPLTKVQQRLLNEVLAYREGRPNETGATASDGHRNEASNGERVLRYGGHRGRRSWLKRPSLAGVLLAAFAAAALLLVQVVSGSGSRVLANNAAAASFPRRLCSIRASSSPPASRCRREAAGSLCAGQRSLRLC